MKSDASSPQEYIANLPDERRKHVQMLRQTILENLPDGYTETMSYGMITYAVPHSLYPQGYHCNKKEPVPYLYIASQKNHIALYHFCLYIDPYLIKWFAEEYKKLYNEKPDFGKGCIRFRNANRIPHHLIAKMVKNKSVTEYIRLYEEKIRR